MNKAQNIFNKALMIMDMKGDLDRGEELILESIGIGKDDFVLQFEAKSCLEEVYIEKGDVDAAKYLLASILNMEIPDDYDDVVEATRQRCQENYESING